MTGKTKDRALTLIWPALVLLVPLTQFLKFQHYPLITPESLIMFGVWALVGLFIGWGISRLSGWKRALLAGLPLTLFMEYLLPITMAHIGWSIAVWVLMSVLARMAHRHLHVFASLIFAVMLVSTLFKSIENGTATEMPPLPTANATLPAILHIVLDEHMATGALPYDIPGARDLAETIETQYVERGFRLWSRAYSEYFFTKNSLSHVLNLASDTDLTLTGSGGVTFAERMSHNRYVGALHAQGYVSTVIQSDYLDVCSATGDEAPDQCQTYAAFPLQFVAKQPWPAITKARTIGGFFLTISEIYTSLRQLYYLIQQGLSFLPEWNWELSRMAPIGALEVMQNLPERVANMGRGEALFTHILLPHSPYSLDETCVLTNPNAWEERRNRVLPSAMGNTPEGRVRRTTAYIRQVACVRNLMTPILDAFITTHPDGIILVHGDHGSRIASYDPRESRREDLSPRDLVESYATLFAVRSPNIPAGLDIQYVSIQDMTASLMNSNFGLPTGVAPSPMVHLSRIGKRIGEPVPLPAFNDGIVESPDSP